VSSIVFHQVSRSFDRGRNRVAALAAVSLAVAEREFVAVVGPSGCGKTTLLRMAAGLDQPTSGTVEVGGRQVRGPGPERAVVFQQFALFPWKTVRQNIEFGLKCIGRPAGERKATVERYLVLMGLEGRGAAYPHELSGGMQQRVALARSYAVDPAVLLMDEPFGALDAQTRIVMQEELVRISRLSPRTVLFVTHSVDEAVYLADRVVVMTSRPGGIREIIDVATVRNADGWHRFNMEDVMDRDAFVHLRTHAWKLLRDPAYRAATPIPEYLAS
jgi:NitT/TauT family transport system ATP-binding protein